MLSAAASSNDETVVLKCFSTPTAHGAGTGAFRGSVENFRWVLARSIIAPGMVPKIKADMRLFDSEQHHNEKASANLRSSVQIQKLELLYRNATESLQSNRSKQRQLIASDLGHR
jgi:hypothetical protein